MVGVGAGFDYHAGNIVRHQSGCRKAIWSGYIDFCKIQSGYLEDTGIQIQNLFGMP